MPMPFAGLGPGLRGGQWNSISTLALLLVAVSGASCTCVRWVAAHKRRTSYVREGLNLLLCVFLGIYLRSILRSTGGIDCR